MRGQTPPFTALRSFEAAARHMSFARAADELGVTPSAISQQVAALEELLGIELFRRTHRKVHPTEAGSVYRAALSGAFDRIESATAELQSNHSGECVRIGVLPSLSIYWLIPRLKRFARMNPTMRLEVVTLHLDFTTSERAPDMQGNHIDIAVFYGDGHWPNLVSERLMSEQLVAVTARSGDNYEWDPGDWLADRPLLQHSTRPESWPQWFQQQEQPARTPNGPAFEHFYMLIEAAKAGMGIALVPEIYVQAELRTGALVRASEFLLRSERAYYCVLDPARTKDPSLMKVRTWLRSEAMSVPGGHHGS